MSMNGPMVMYKIQPLFNYYPDISLPTCMYKMKNIYGESKVPEPSKEVMNPDDLKLLEIEKHQLNIIQKLEDLKMKVLKMKDDLGVTLQQPSFEKFQDIVVKSNPDYPPLSIWVFYKLLSQTVPTRLVNFIHSSLTKVPQTLQVLKDISNSHPCKVSLSVIWRDGIQDQEMMVDPVHQGVIEGEVNIARYISRLISFNYDSDPILATRIDDWLELAHSSIIHGNNKERQAALKSLNSHLGKNIYLVEDSITVADIAVWSAVVQTKLHKDLPTNVGKWYKALIENELFTYCKDLPFL